jgi:hypothetical protein
MNAMLVSGCALIATAILRLGAALYRAQARMLTFLGSTRTKISICIEEKSESGFS